MVRDRQWPGRDRLCPGALKNLIAGPSPVSPGRKPHPPRMALSEKRPIRFVIVQLQTGGIVRFFWVRVGEPRSNARFAFWKDFSQDITLHELMVRHK